MEQSPSQDEFSRLQDLEKEHNGQSKGNIVNKGKSGNLRWIRQD